MWLPIESAPKDGARILGYFPTHTDAYKIGVTEWGGPPGYVEHWMWGGKWSPCNPTHWQPLPEPPQ